MLDVILVAAQWFRFLAGPKIEYARICTDSDGDMFAIRAEIQVYHVSHQARRILQRSVGICLDYPDKPAAPDVPDLGRGIICAGRDELPVRADRDRADCAAVGRDLPQFAAGCRVPYSHRSIVAPRCNHPSGISAQCYV